MLMRKRKDLPKEIAHAQAGYTLTPKKIITGMVIGVAAGIIVLLINASLPFICTIICPQETTIEGIITQNDKPVSNVDIIINGHKNLTGGDGKFVILDIQLEPGLKINIDLPSPPPIAYDSDHYVDLELDYMLRRELDDLRYKEISSFPTN